MAKLHERKFISADPEKCVGCQICEYACSFGKERVFNPTKSRIRVIRENQINNIAVTCRLCETPACVAACPRNALSQSITGNIIIEKENCTGCGWCIAACDYGAMMLHPETKIVYSCDLCKFRADGPQCVKWCPEEALTVVTSDVLAQKARLSAIKKLFQTPGETRSQQPKETTE
ncbi:MAG: 4Fe-4S dicluster domain-containing protein [Candidatus Bathyarchaeia archaeon]|jgi:Fe-S-cluster-containing hydrogenase component 2